MPNLLRRLSVAARRRFSVGPPVASPPAPPLAIDSPNSALRVGDKIGKFSVKESRDFPDFHTRMLVLEHEVHGTKYIHFDSSDANKSFAFHFRTLPVNDKGIPHILEHTVLCGSERFPVKDPFFSMLKRSLNTYMNAWTGPDLTMYPFSTTNDKDFLNLLQVYSDAVFRPTLSREDFLQEGWRLELEDGKLQFKGVVFNEMKGEMETQNAVFMQEASRHLFQGSEFAFNFGGEPAAIPDLSLDELRKFYTKYYHPSNCGLVSYGNLSVRDTLGFLEKEYLDKASAEVSTFSPKPSALVAPREIVTWGPADPVCLDPQSNSQFGVSYLCDELLSSPLDYVGMEILSSAMFDYPSSPFYQAFIAKKVATDYCVGHGFGDFVRYPVFTIGFRDLPNAVPKIEAIKAQIFELLKEIQEKGLDPMLLESILHTYELKARLSKQNFGISLFGSLSTPLNYADLGLIDAHLNITETMRQIREKMAAGRYFEGLVQKYLLENPKRLDLIVVPDPNFQTKIIQNEAQKLSKLTSGLSEAQKTQIAKDCADLHAKQDRKHNFDVLPKLSVADISREQRHWAKQYLDVEGIRTLFVNEHTNSTTHCRIKVDLGTVPRSFLRYLAFLVDFIPKLGTKHNHYTSWGTYVGRYTGGIRTSLHSTATLDGAGVNAFMVIQSSCLDRNMDVMFNVLAEVLTEFDTNDEERVSQLLTAYGYETGLSFSSEAHGLAQVVAEAGVARPAWFLHEYEMNKLGYLFAKNSQIASMPEVYQEDLRFNFNYLTKKVFTKSGLSFMVHSAPENKEQVQSDLRKLVERLRKGFNHFEVASQFMEDEVEFALDTQKEFHVLPNYINYCARAYKAPNYLHPDAPRLQMAGKLIAGEFLHPLIREKGGAYGSNCTYSFDGSMTMSTYRDPNTLKSFENFDISVAEVAAGNFTDEQVEGAKLGLFSKIDELPVPENRCVGEFLYGIDEDLFHKRRLELLEVSKEDIQAVTQTYLARQEAGEHFKDVVFGNVDQAMLKELEAGGWKIDRFAESVGDKAAKGDAPDEESAD